MPPASLETGSAASGLRILRPLQNPSSDQIERRRRLMISETSSTSGVTRVLSPEDRVLDDLWRERFGEPLPILGSGEIVRRILAADPRQPTPGSTCQPHR
jgi:hypothetical protein